MKEETRTNITPQEEEFIKCKIMSAQATFDGVYITDLIKAYKITSSVLSDLYSELTDRQKDFWSDAREQIFDLLQTFDEVLMLQYANTNIVEIPPMFDADEDFPNANIVGRYDKKLKEDVKNAVKHSVISRDMAEMYCDFHHHKIGPETWYDAWLGIYNKASENLRLPLYGFTKANMRKMSPKALLYSISLTKDKISEAKTAKRKAKLQEGLDAMVYEYHTRVLYMADFKKKYLKMLLYKDLPPKKPSAEEILSQKQEDVSFKMETMMALTKKMIKAEENPARKKVFFCALNQMAIDYQWLCRILGNTRRAAMFCKKLRISELA